jgi:hypothetical protein
MISPEAAFNCGKVDVIRARIPPSEKLPPRDLLLSAMRIARLREHTYVWRHDRTCRVAGENVENGLGRQTGDGCAPRMFEDQRETGSLEALPQLAGLCCKESGPG